MPPADPRLAKVWLRSVQPDTVAKVRVLWAEEVAVQTEWGVFSEYWDDFCYPSSDDVIAIPIVGNWELRYHYYEEFDFGSAFGAERA